MPTEGSPSQMLEALVSKMKEQEPDSITEIEEQIYGNSDALNQKIEETLFGGLGYKLIDEKNNLNIPHYNGVLFHPQDEYAKKPTVDSGKHPLNKFLKG